MNNINIVIEKLNLKKIHFSKDGLELWALCPAHNDRNANNFSINLITGQCFCFACGYTSNMVQLLFDKEENYTKALQLWYIVRRNDKECDINLTADILSNYQAKQYRKFGYAEYGEKRLGSKEVLSAYNIYQDKLKNPVFIVQDQKKQDRAIWVRENENYYLIEPLSSKRDGWLYGMHLPLVDNKIILVEGFFDAPSVYMKTGLVGWGLLGTQYSKRQISNLKQSGATIYLLLDGDQAGKLARRKIFEELYIDCDIKVCGGYKGDPDELSQSELNTILKNAKEWDEYLEMIKDK